MGVAVAGGAGGAVEVGGEDLQPINARKAIVVNVISQRVFIFLLSSRLNRTVAPHLIVAGKQSMAEISIETKNVFKRAFIDHGFGLHCK
jgi:hypothetical protein